MSEKTHVSEKNEESFRRNNAGLILLLFRFINVQLENISGLFVMACLVMIAVLSVVEVSSRVTARNFLDYKISIINERLAAEASGGFYSEISPEKKNSVDYQEKINQLIDNKSFYQKQTDILSYLEFSGADNDGYTVYAIQKNIEFNEKKLLILPSIERSIDEVNNLNSSISELDSELSRIMNIRDGLRGENISADLSEGDAVAILNPYLSSLDRSTSRFDESFYNSISDNYPFSKVSDFMSLPSDSYVRIQSELIDQTDDYSLRLKDRISFLNSKVEAEQDKIVSLRDELGNVLGPDYIADGAVAWSRSLFSSFRSDVLLAVALVCCGGIGSMAAGMRRYGLEAKRQQLAQYPWFGDTRDQLLGFSAGFVSFLVIKGGKSLFLIQSIENSAVINPYGCALAGIMAGLFTEKAYQLLSKIFDQATDAIAKEKGAEGARKDRADEDAAGGEKGGS